MSNMNFVASNFLIRGWCGASPSERRFFSELGEDGELAEEAEREGDEDEERVWCATETHLSTRRRSTWARIAAERGVALDLMLSVKAETASSTRSAATDFTVLRSFCTRKRRESSVWNCPLIRGGWPPTRVREMRRALNSSMEAQERLRRRHAAVELSSLISSLPKKARGINRDETG